MQNFFFKRIFYCSPAFAFAIPTFPVMILLPAIYVENYSLSLSQIGIVLFLAKIIDVISDPLMGWVNDKNVFSRKKWILIGAILAGTSLYNLILPYTFPNILYLFVWISVLYLGWTIFQVSYLSIGYDLESNYEERSRLSAGREFFVLLGLLASVSFPVFYEESNIKSEVFLVYLAIISGLVCIFFFLIFIKEKRKNAYHQPFEFTKVLYELKTNNYLRKLLFPWFINSLANSFPMVLFVFFISTVLDGQSSDQEFILFLYFLSAVLGMFFWIYMIRHIEKKDIWRLSMLISSFIFIFVFFIQSGDIFLFSIISCLTGFCLGADMAIPPSIQCDITDYHKQRFKKDISGILFSLLIFSNKITFAIATLVTFSLLDFFEYNFEDSTSDKSDLLLTIMYAGIPIIMKLFTVSSLRKFDLSKKKMEKITKNLYG